MKKKLLVGLATGLFLVGMVGLASATTIVGGSLLTNSYANILEAELGEGELTFTNIFKDNGSNTSTDFHNAADGQGRTIILMTVASGNSIGDIIGGYNPFSWNTSGNYTRDYSPGEAFIFNLTNNDIRHQTNNDTTYNYNTYGPTFGSGHDIYVDSTLRYGYTYNYSYNGGHPLGYGNGITTDFWITLSGLEAYTLSSDNGESVPEPATMLLFGTGLAGLAGSRLRRKKKA